MKRFWTAVAVASCMILAIAGCNDYGNTFQYSVPSLISISPSNVNAGGPDLTITLSANFSALQAQTYLTWNQKKVTTTVTTDPTTGGVTGVTAVIPAALTGKPGTYFIQAVNPNNTNGTGYANVSNALPFVVNPVPTPLPTISGISPSSAAAGSASVALTITGTNFLPTTDPSGGSQLHWNTTSQTTLTATSLTSTQIQTTIPASLLTTAGTALVTVYNPPAPNPPGCTPGVNCGGSGGGGTSACPLITGSTTLTVCTFTITDPPANGAAKLAAQVQAETPALSSDGRFVAYTAVQNGHSQIFVRDTCQGADSSCKPATMLVSAAQDGTTPDGDSHAPSISSDGRYVGFSSSAPNLTPDSTTGRQVYLRDTCLGVTDSCTPSTLLVSNDPNGNLEGLDSILPSVSSSGRFVAFLAVTPDESDETAPASGSPKAAVVAKSPANSSGAGFRQVFVRDTCLGARNCTPSTTRITLQPGNDSLTGGSKPAGPAISGSGDHLALTNGNTATLFTHAIAVDEGVFLALTKNQN
ncbi:MAG TPA: hypothetical protein VJN93_02440 [Candidatus Acidoferrum sp.]|nr:hypothetical protein [Candidatus Acidoferrum sp.]